MPDSMSLPRTPIRRHPWIAGHARNDNDSSIPRDPHDR